MALFNFLTGKGRVRVPLTPDEAREQGSTMVHRREWVCECGSALRIRSKDPHPDGISNFVPYPNEHKLGGHSQIPPIFLTWNGLAEERGWKTDPVQCPACQRGLSRNDYKQGRRLGHL